MILIYSAHSLNPLLEVTNATDLANKSLRVIADHIRSCSFPCFVMVSFLLMKVEAMCYVVLSVVLRHGYYMLGAKDTFFYKLVVAPLIDVMAEAGKELKNQQEIVEKVLKTEEEQFTARTLERAGLQLLDEELEN